MFTVRELKQLLEMFPEEMQDYGFCLYYPTGAYNKKTKKYDDPWTDGLWQLQVDETHLHDPLMGGRVILKGDYTCYGDDDRIWPIVDKDNKPIIYTEEAN